jgi:hypothetical protein
LEEKEESESESERGREEEGRETVYKPLNEN